MEFLKSIQADIMMILTGICGIIALLVHLTDTMSQTRKKALMLLEISAMFLMIADRHAYMARGDISTTGWWMVRISNFLAFFLTLVTMYALNMYLIDLFTHEGKLDAAPKRLKAAKILALVGMALVVISQFTGFYYTFDEMNRYQRAPGFILCYAIPFLILVLQMSVTVQYYRRLSRSIGLSALLFFGLSIMASVLQVFMYGISLNNISIAVCAALLYIFALRDLNREVACSRKLEIEHYKEEREKEHLLFEQTAEALASAIDAKDPYTHGHSARVAMYSTQIAREAGLSEEECEQVYFTALLHDVGKIGVPSAVINKPGRLTDEEFAIIKQHPVKGNQILSSIQQSPYLSIGAHYHHERYDGRGYPTGLKGNDIPDIARIIGVADAYDAMTSKRSYRDPIPQQTVREEIVKGIGTQFDPEYAKIMIHLIDLDMEYTMRERENGADDTIATRLRCEEIFHECTTGIPVTQKKTLIQFYSKPDEGLPEDECLPVLVLFDALDARIHEDEAKKKDLLYFEYARIRLDGKVLCEGARKAKTKEKTIDTGTEHTSGKQYVSYSVEATRVKDHMLISISGRNRMIECIIALPDSARFSYLSLTGEHCMISNIRVDRENTDADEGSIPRIAEEISYIRGCPEGDIPNLQIDGWRSQTTKGIPVTDSMEITFHTRSLPTARLIWHCPFITLFTSKDGNADGAGFREFVLLRLDGENWESDKHAENDVHIDHTRDFPGWNVWKETNKNGMDCTVKIRRDGNRVTMETSNLGIAIDTATTILDDVSEIYVALTGDQCALTNIRIAQCKDENGTINSSTIL
jgi:HD-GYP domain-containing protein (c-di-GMP phosphodiesterase class II)